MAAASIEHPPASFKAIVASVDPSSDGLEMKIAHDLVSHYTLGSQFEGWREAGGYIEALLTDPGISNSDLKRLLRKTAGPVWGIQFEFGADAKAARRYLEALSVAIAREMK